MMKQLHQEANRRPNTVSGVFATIDQDVSVADTFSYLQSFVDHYAGEVDAHTGRPISGTRVRAASAAVPGSNVGVDDLSDEFAAYSFYGELSEDVERALSQQRRAGAARARIAPGTRIDTVEL